MESLNRMELENEWTLLKIERAYYKNEPISEEKKKFIDRLNKWGYKKELNNKQKIKELLAIRRKNKKIEMETNHKQLNRLTKCELHDVSKKNHYKPTYSFFNLKKSNFILLVYHKINSGHIVLSDYDIEEIISRRLPRFYHQEYYRLKFEEYMKK